MRKTQPPKGCEHSDNQVADGISSTRTIKQFLGRTQDTTTMDENTGTTQTPEGIISSEKVAKEISNTSPDELRQQLRELTEKNCAAALQEIEQILARRGLKMYPIVHVEGSSVNYTIAIAPL